MLVVAPRPELTIASRTAAVVRIGRTIRAACFFNRPVGTIAEKDIGNTLQDTTRSRKSDVNRNTSGSISAVRICEGASSAKIKSILAIKTTPCQDIALSINCENGIAATFYFGNIGKEIRARISRFPERAHLVWRCPARKTKSAGLASVIKSIM